MYKTQSFITLAETDATGVIFYPKLLEKCLWALESFLAVEHRSLKKFFDKKIFLPVVNVQLDFFLPLSLSDSVEIQLFLEKMGTTSLTLSYEVYKDAKLAAKALITHVVVDQERREKKEIDSELKEFFREKLA